MASAVTAPMRAAGWNVRLTIGTRERPQEFAGLYQNPRAPTLTFADICVELGLCFELPRSQCAHYLSDPRRFNHPSYLPYNKTQSDPRLSIMPLRRKLKARSQSPPKRSAGLTSPSKPDDGDGDDDYANMIAPASLDINMDSAKKQVSDFRMECIAQSTCCAVSGDGEPWSSIQPIGPGVQACHIVPQQHFHLYPMEDGNGDSMPEDSAHRLC
ncbi:hypothetical protein ISF_07466 [Cordyceps fumosorosea ARSEF 2679]|uniref:HNH nuclease domain-containing protein n=1 Tax=Cordyceps fumosorosea (strain ARSEF 2679) TaxID=1081104 RepID=A0A167P8M4_CORFA|nr:hypothetical protein ISF_07466 [Cordyceps fumosorosea ARSEF 2679]OAA56398.1 hypothetical protein ISF_07466 [Cordyceps fumosorosea ARSEF 2679]